MPEFLQQLQQRHVVRAALIYAAAVWALAQGIAQLSPVFGLSPKVTLWFVIACVIGFPFWIAFAWFFRFTPHGIAREDDMATDAAALRRTGHRLDYWIIGILAIAVVLLLTNQLVLQRGKTIHEFTATAVTASPAAHVAPKPVALPAALATVIPAKSVAVLPFENLSASKANAYFADGVQDLILTKLADIGDLKVIARTSTESYGAHPENLTLVGKQLGVATILEGSVQKAGTQVLINVQLIDARTDSHVWAKSYQRTLDNIFGVEGEVAEKVANALNAKLTATESIRVAKAPTHNPAAYNAFLQGQYYGQRAVGSELAADYTKARQYYRQAVTDDPKFALAWARLTYVAAQQIQLLPVGARQSALAATANAALGHALALAPDAPDVRLAQGWYKHWVAHDLAGALAAFKAVLATQPHNANALFGAGIIYQHLGQYRVAADFFRKAVTASPRDVDFRTQLGIDYLFLRDYPRAQQTLRRALALDPHSVYALGWLVNAYVEAGELDQAQAVLNATSPGLQHNPAFAFDRATLALVRRNFGAARKAMAQWRPGGSQTQAVADALRGRIVWLTGNRDLARSFYRHAAWLSAAELRRAPDDWHAMLLHGSVLAGLGQGSQALATMHRALALATQRGDKGLEDGVRLYTARVLAQLGKGKRASAILGDLLSRPTRALISPALVRLAPVWDPIRHDPAFQALLKKYGEAKPAHAASTPSP